MKYTTKQKIWNIFNLFSALIFTGILIVDMSISLTYAADAITLNNLEFSSLSGNQVQLQLEMNEPVPVPKIFQTDNPARIALDFKDVKSNLAKKSYPINQGAVGTVYIIEAEGRTRVIVNLLEKVPYETKIDGNKLYLILRSTVLPINVSQTAKSEEHSIKDSAISKFLPEQAIKTLDFRRGSNGEGQILVGLSAENTVINAKQNGGKVIVNFLNTQLPQSLIKTMDVSDFATPVQKFDVIPHGENSNIIITPNNSNFEFSTYQTNNLLTIEFRPLTPLQKEELRKETFTGDKLSLNFQDIEIRSVLQILADFTDLNIIASDAVSGNVTLRLNDVPWDQALELILKSKGLDKRQNGNVIMVAPVAEIMKIEQAALDSQKVYAQLEPLKTEYIQINYAKAGEICGVIIGIGNTSQGGQSGAGGTGGGTGASGGGGGGGGGGGCGGISTTTQNGVNTNLSSGNNASTGALSNTLRLLSNRGTAIIDARTNTLIVKDTPKVLEEVRKVVKLLDVPIRQVLIETRIVIANTNFARQLGVNFGVNTQAANAAQAAGTYPGLAELGYALNGAAAVATGGASTLGMTLAAGADAILDLQLRALQNEDKGEVISNPRVMTTDRVKATILQGVQIPYTTQTANTLNTNFKDAVLELDVTPQITPGGSVIMDLIINDDSQGQTITTGGQQNVAINKKGLTAKVQVEDGETLVLGGVYQSVYDNQTNIVPWLGEIPWIGFLFKYNAKVDNKQELLIFVTPKIVKNSLKIK